MNKEQIIEAIKGMTVLELNELVKACEEEFGVSAAAPVAVAGAGGNGPVAERCLAVRCSQHHADASSERRLAGEYPVPQGSALCGAKR